MELDTPFGAGVDGRRPISMMIARPSNGSSRLPDKLQPGPFLRVAALLLSLPANPMLLAAQNPVLAPGTRSPVPFPCGAFGIQAFNRHAAAP